ncbi:MAG TPA: hypothetical protein EYG46_04770 [Myxococcales bacterium]|nr:hypothetical protein [Myxococcales bacterium]
MGAALSAALSAVFRVRLMGRFLFRVMRTKLECAAQRRGIRSYAPRFVKFVRSESIVRHRAKKGRGSLSSWNRASVVLAGVVVLCLLCLPGAVAWAQEETTEAADVVTDTATEIDTAESDEERMEESDSMFDDGSVYYDHVGWYVRGGVFGGFLEGRKGVDFDPGIGFSVAGGLRHNRWMAVEVNYSKVYESETNDIEPKNTRSVEEYEVGFDLHFYPLGLIEVSAVSDRLQPYVSGGFGFSEVDVSSSKQTLYMLRIGGGLDMYVTEKLGIYVDGSYSIMSGTTIGNQNNVLSGRGSIGWGAFARF